MLDNYIFYIVVLFFCVTVGNLCYIIVICMVGIAEDPDLIKESCIG